jgi:hypothetical protein
MNKFGLGDLAYYLFRPVVYFTDWVWGTDLKDCDRCKARRKRWNRWAVPLRLAITFFVTICAAGICWLVT